MARILSRFDSKFYALICVVCVIVDAEFFIPFQTPADCVELSGESVKSLYFNTIQLKCVECEQPKSAQTVSPDGAFSFSLLK